MDPLLLVALVVGVATVVVLVLTTRLDAFASLLLGTLLTGLLAGQSLMDIVDSMAAGFGDTLASIGFVIGLGVAIGKILEVSGAAQALAMAVLRRFGKGREPWAMAGTGVVLSVPVFGDSAYVLMTPLARAIARMKGTGYATLGIALAAGVALTHNLVPPTPGPLAAAGILGADIGQVILVGTIFSVVMTPVCVAYARIIGPRVEPFISEDVQREVYGATRVGGQVAENVREAGDSTFDPVDASEGGLEDGIAPELKETPPGKKPHTIGPWIALVPLLVPVLLIVGNTAATAIDRSRQKVLEGDYTPSAWTEPLLFIGSPMVALLIGLVLAVYVLLPRWTPKQMTHRWLTEAAASAGIIILITGAGGALGGVLRESGIGDALADGVGSLPLPAFLLPFVIGTLVRIAQGSAVVATTTAAGVTAPLIPVLGLHPVVAVFACIMGAMGVSHYNDSFFWVVTRMIGLEGTAALKAQTGMTGVQWVTAIPLLFILDIIL